MHARSPLLRLQSDDRLIALVRRGNATAFEVLVSRYESRLLAFCRHLLSSREDAEDVLQEVFAAAFNAMTADERPINVRPWLYRIARNRSLNHLRRMQAIGVDSMDVHLSDNGASTADKVHEREEFRLLVGDIHELPETQKTALVLREMDALSYEQIAEAMETTVPSVKSLLVRARISLAEASEARLLSCNEVRIELGEVAEGLLRRPSPLVRRHLRACTRCTAFRSQLKQTNKALAAVMPIGPLVLLKKLIVAHLGHSAGSSATGAGAAGSTAAAGSTIMAGSTAGGFVSAGMGAIATKAAAGLAAAALVTAGAVEVGHSGKTEHHHQATASCLDAGIRPARSDRSHAQHMDRARASARHEGQVDHEDEEGDAEDGGCKSAHARGRGVGQSGLQDRRSDAAQGRRCAGTHADPVRSHRARADAAHHHDRHHAGADPTPGGCRVAAAVLGRHDDAADDDRHDVDRSADDDVGREHNDHDDNNDDNDFPHDHHDLVLDRPRLRWIRRLGIRQLQRSRRVHHLLRLDPAALHAVAAPGESAVSSA